MAAEAEPLGPGGRPAWRRSSSAKWPVMSSADLYAAAILGSAQTAVKEDIVGLWKREWEIREDGGGFMGGW